MDKYDSMPQITKEEATAALTFCTEQIKRILPNFTHVFQSPSSE